MKTIIAGSRHILDFGLVEEAMDDAINAWSINPTLIISGHAGGIDTLGEQWAVKWFIPTAYFPVMRWEWDKYGKAAGPMRNRRMAEVADALVAVWDGKSPGTGNMIEEAGRRGLRVHVMTV